MRSGVVELSARMVRMVLNESFTAAKSTSMAYPCTKLHLYSIPDRHHGAHRVRPLVRSRAESAETESSCRSRNFDGAPHGADRAARNPDNLSGGCNEELPSILERNHLLGGDRSRHGHVQPDAPRRGAGQRSLDLGAVRAAESSSRCGDRNLRRRLGAGELPAEPNRVRLRSVTAHHIRWSRALRRTTCSRLSFFSNLHADIRHPRGRLFLRPQSTPRGRRWLAVDSSSGTHIATRSEFNL